MGNPYNAGLYGRLIATDDFVMSNRLKINRDVAIELVKRSVKEADFFVSEALLRFIPLDVARVYLPPEHIDAIDAGIEPHEYIETDIEGAQDFCDYLNFAWRQAASERRISAHRSIVKLSAKMRALSRPDIAAVLEDDGLYDPYGIPALLKTGEMLSLDAPDELASYLARYRLVYPVNTNAEHRGA